MTALPRLTDTNGELTLLVWDGKEDRTFAVSQSAVANLAQDCVDAMARRCRKLDGKEPTR